MPLKTASGVGRGRALAAVGNGSRGAAGPPCSGTVLAAVAPSMLAFASGFLSAFFAGFEAFGLAELAFEPAVLALAPLDFPPLDFPPLGLAAPPRELLAEPLPALVSAPPLLADAVVRVPAEELLADVLLAPPALLVLALDVLALLVLALEVLGLLVLALEVLALLLLAFGVEALLAAVPRLAGLPAEAVRVLLDRVPVVPLARDPVEARVPAERAVALVAGREARVLLDAGAVLAAAVAVDIALATSVSDLTADSIALVAVLIDCRAVVIVLADVVALLAAEFSLVAAFVTLVDAADTARGVGADLAVPRLVVVRLLAGRLVLLLVRLLLERLPLLLDRLPLLLDRLPLVLERLPVVVERLPLVLVRLLLGRLLLVRLVLVRLLVVRPPDDLDPLDEVPDAAFLVLDLAELGFAVLALPVADLVVARFAVAGGTDLSPRS